MRDLSYIIEILNLVETWEREDREGDENWVLFYERMAEREYYRFEDKEVILKDWRVLKKR